MTSYADQEDQEDVLEKYGTRRSGSLPRQESTEVDLAGMATEDRDVLGRVQ